MGSNKLGLSPGPATQSLRPIPLKKKNVPSSSVGPMQSASGQGQAGPKACLAVCIPGRDEGRAATQGGMRAGQVKGSQRQTDCMMQVSNEH